MRARHAAVLATLAIGAAFLACTLNPQPLPPESFGDNAGASNDASTADASFGGTAPTEGPSDASPGVDHEGGTPTPSNASDDAGDGATDADAG
jgi:hypothetical protein